MATYQYTPMPATEGPQVMSIGDMINTARAGQAYQQQQQLNPLAVQQQQQVVAKGGIELGQLQQVDRERKNLQEFFANPDNGPEAVRLGLAVPQDSPKESPPPVDAA